MFFYRASFNKFRYAIAPYCCCLTTLVEHICIPENLRNKKTKNVDFKAWWWGLVASIFLIRTPKGRKESKGNNLVFGLGFPSCLMKAVRSLKQHREKAWMRQLNLNWYINNVLLRKYEKPITYKMYTCPRG